MSYIGTQPNNVLKNTGLYNPNEILQLTKEGSWGGSTQLITSSSSDNSAQTLEFNDCFTERYDVYLIQWKDFVPANDENMLYFRLKNASGEITSGYQYAVQQGGSSFSESKSTSATYLRVMGGGGSSTGENASGYIYVYSPTNASKYSFINLQTTFIDQNANYTMFFGGGVHPTAESVTGAMFRSISSGGTLGNINTLDVSIYGVKQI
jgi:hypothetical protein